MLYIELEIGRSIDRNRGREREIINKTNLKERKGDVWKTR